MSVLSQAAVAIAVPVVFALLRRYLPASGTPSADDSIDAAGAESYVNAATFAVLVLFGSICYFLFADINRRIALNDGHPERILLSTKSIWLFFPLFGGICFAWDITLFLWGLYAGRHLPEAYAEWSDQKAGMAGRRFLRWMGLLVALPIGIATLLALPIHTNFDQDGISIGHFARLGTERHPYAGVTGFTVANGVRNRDGSTESRPTILLTFDDGTSWSSWSQTEANKLDTGLLAFLKMKLHREPDYKDFY